MLVIVLSIIVYSFLAASGLAAVVGPSSNEIEQIDLLKNVTNAPRVGAIDPRFSVTYRPGPDSLSATSCLMSAVNAMMELALENFTQPIAVRNYVAPDYPEIVIVATGPGQRAEARFLLWGVWEGIRWMINHHSFRDLLIHAYWDGIPICSIWIRGYFGGLSTAGSNGTLSLLARSENGSTHDARVVSPQGLSTMDVRNPLNDYHLTISVIEVGDNLGIIDVFIAVFAALEYMAPFPSTDEVDAFQISSDGGNTMIGILEHTRAPAYIPPYLEYQWVILSIGQIPEYMLLQRSFTEVVVEIALDGVPLGEAFLFK